VTKVSANNLDFFHEMEMQHEYPILRDANEGRPERLQVPDKERKRDQNRKH
jgi:hypothetical protein